MRENKKKKFEKKERLRVSRPKRRKDGVVV